jgi:exonuclease III
MNPSNLLCWNVWGLNSRARQDAVRNLVDSSRADIVCLQETKMADLSRGVILSSLGSDFDMVVTLLAVGSAGGVLIAWRHHIGYSGVHRVDSFSVSVQFHFSADHVWWLTCVYGL